MWTITIEFQGIDIAMAVIGDHKETVECVQINVVTGTAFSQQPIYVRHRLKDETSGVLTITEDSIQIARQELQSMLPIQIH